MTPQTQAVYDAAMVAARRLGTEGFRGDLILAVIDSAEVQAVLPKWGVGDLLPTFLDDIEREASR